MLHKTGTETGTEQGMRTEAWLAIDTATDHMTIAVMRGMEVIAVNDTIVERNHSVRLIPEVQELLKQAGFGMRDIRAIAIGRGPGSYTGVRIGITVAKTWAWSLGLPLVSVSSIGALAFGYVRLHEQSVFDEADAVTVGESRGYAEGDIVWIVPILDARRKQVFTGLYAWQQGSRDAQDADARASDDGDREAFTADTATTGRIPFAEDGDREASTADSEAAGRIPFADNGDRGASTANTTTIGRIPFAEAGVHGVWQQLEQDRIILFSDWMEHIRGMLRECSESSRPQRIVLVGETDNFQEDASVLAEQTGVNMLLQQQDIHAQDIAWLAWHRLVRQEVDDIHGLVPNYTQLAEAEQKLLSKQQ